MFTIPLIPYLAVNAVIFLAEFFACGINHPTIDGDYINLLAKIVTHTACGIPTIWIFILDMVTYVPILIYVVELALKLRDASIPGIAAVIAAMAAVFAVFAIVLGFSL